MLLVVSFSPEYLLFLHLGLWFFNLSKRLECTYLALHFVYPNSHSSKKTLFCIQIFQYTVLFYILFKLYSVLELFSHLKEYRFFFIISFL